MPVDKRKLAVVLCGVGGLAGIYYLRKWVIPDVLGIKGNDTSRQEKKRSDQLAILRRTLSKVLVVESIEEWELAHKLLLVDLWRVKAIGLDCEWVTKDGKAQPVALLQIASQQGTCILLRLCKFRDRGNQIPETLIEILANSGIRKFGVGISEDVRKLFRHYGLKVSGWVDLRNLVLRCRGFQQFGNYGLKRLYEAICHKILKKSKFIQCSNWEDEVLSHDQVEYAANDAFSAVDIFTELVIDRMSRSCGQFHSVERDFQSRSSSMCQGILELNHIGSGTSSGAGGDEKSLKRGHTSSTKSKSDAVRSYCLRKQPLYHNCQLRAPDGQLLCTCDKKKAEWYIEKGLGIKILDEPLTVRLEFEPAGRPESEENYYLQDKDNICVVCGAPDSYVRKCVVPHEYRKHFPILLKNHRSHDILLLCVSCHQRSGVYDGVLRQQFAMTCNAPIGSVEDVQFRQDPELSRVRSSAKALLKSGDKIPQDRLEILTNIVKNYFGVTQITGELLEQAVDMDVRVPSDKYSPHGLKVVQHMLENGGLLKFERLWRNNFVSTMQPKFLPHKWSVDHNHVELEGLESELKHRLGTS